MVGRIFAIGVNIFLTLVCDYCVLGFVVVLTYVSNFITQIYAISCFNRAAGSVKTELLFFAESESIDDKIDIKLVSILS